MAERKSPSDQSFGRENRADRYGFDRRRHPERDGRGFEARHD